MCADLVIQGVGCHRRFVLRAPNATNLHVWSDAKCFFYACIPSEHRYPACTLASPSLCSSPEPLMGAIRQELRSHSLIVLTALGPFLLHIRQKSLRRSHNSRFEVRRRHTFRFGRQRLQHTTDGTQGLAAVNEILTPHRLSIPTTPLHGSETKRWAVTYAAQAGRRT